MKKLLLAVSMTALLAACGQADDTATLTSGVDVSGFDTSVRPQDDFNGYVNGGWIARTEIPADRSRYGTFNLLRERSEERVKAIIEDLSAKEGSAEGSEEAKIGNFFNTLMNADAANEAGAAPLSAMMTEISAVRDHAGVVRMFAALRKVGVTSPFVMYVNVDSGDSTKYAIYMTQSGLGLPNRDYYLKEGEKFDAIRAAYPDFMSGLLASAGFDQADDRAIAVIALENKIATAHWKAVDNRDATKTNNRIAVGELNGVSDQINWTSFFDEAGVIDVNEAFVRQPSYFKALGGILAETPVDVWKDYLRFHMLNEFAPWMGSAFEDRNFAFNGKLIGGQKEPRARWKRSVSVVNSMMGEAVGKEYVKRHFPPAAKARMEELVNNLLAAFEESIDALEWMSAETKIEAQAKREKFTYKIGYPDEWKDYSSMVIGKGSAVANMMSAVLWDYNRDIKKMGGPVDRGEWGMNPQTVNAYFNPRLNEIVFPAGILEAPFFNMDADDAVNYGGIGAVIGHEVGHAFDDQGRKTDGNGNLRDWWTDADAEAFKGRADALVAQYGAYEPIEGLHVNGRLTLGENIGDLTGVTIGYKAYMNSLKGKEAPVIDGFTGPQRFFLGWAQVWRAKAREEYIRRQVLTDPHSPAGFRASGPLVNSDAFYKAFGVKEGDGMYRAPEKRVKIW